MAAFFIDPAPPPGKHTRFKFEIIEIEIEIWQ
jgi:hypothetical protein